MPLQLVSDGEELRADHDALVVRTSGVVTTGSKGALRHHLIRNSAEGGGKALLLTVVAPLQFVVTAICAVVKRLDDGLRGGA